MKYDLIDHGMIYIAVLYSRYDILLCCTQNVEADSFTTHPIIFGDFIKLGAERADRIYEELSDMKKLTNVLQDVSLFVYGRGMSYFQYN